MSYSDILADPEHFRARVLQDALTEATAVYWERRAVQLDQAAEPRPRDRGPADPERQARLTEAAAACRRHAWLIRNHGLDRQALAEIVAMLEEASAA